MSQRHHLTTFLLKMQPSELKTVMVDPKMVEMAGYSGVPHLQCPVITEMDKVVPILRLCVKEMERRYSIFTRMSVRNRWYKMRREEEPELENLPYFVVIVDELADLMMVAPNEVETRWCVLPRRAGPAGFTSHHRDPAAICRSDHRPAQGQHCGPDRVHGDEPETSRVVLESMGAEKRSVAATCSSAARRAEAGPHPGRIRR
ncbi:MAG: FtsK/SpoIIIE domain-containing protein [Thermomicrobiales bacterium]